MHFWIGRFGLPSSFSGVIGLFTRVSQRLVAMSITHTAVFSIPLYGFLYTAPTIIRELGYESVEAQLLTVPVYTTATISTIIVAWLADRRKRRWPFIVFPYAISFCGLIGLLSIPHPKFPGLTYTFLFAVPAGIYPGVITLISWVSNNLAPSWKRAVGTALCVGLGNLGGIVGSNIFLVKESPKYYTGYGVSFACIGLAIISALVLRTAYLAQNRKRDIMSEEEIREKYTDGKPLLSSIVHSSATNYLLNR